MQAKLDNIMNCAKAQKCKEMSDKCVQTYKASDRPWGDLTNCYSVNGNTLLNSLGEPELDFTAADHQNCTNYFSGKNPCIQIEGFNSVNYLTIGANTDSANNYTNLNNVINQINDGDDNSSNEVDAVLTRYQALQSERDLLKSRLDQMNLQNSDIDVEKSSLVYTTLFTTALGTCLLYFFIKMQ